MNRRFFLQSAPVLTATALSTSCRDADETGTRNRVDARTSGQGADEPRWDDVRGQFIISRDKIDMSALLIASHPRPVREAIERHRRGLDQNPTTYLEDEIGRGRSRTLAAAARYMGGRESDIALTDSTTMGLGLMYNGFILGPDEEFLLTDHGYYSTQEAIRLSAARTGAQVRSVELYRHGVETSAEELADRLAAAVQPQTRVVAITWVHSSTGLKMPVRLIADRIAEFNRSRSPRERVYLCVDGVHGFGVENVSVPDLGCDFFAAGCHKWLFGPRGTGVFWGRSDAWPALTPVIPTFRELSVRRAWMQGAEPGGETDGARMQPGGFKAFEHLWAVAEAFEFLEGIGKADVEKRTHQLARQLKEGLAGMNGVTLYTPLGSELSAGIVCFSVAGMSPAQVVQSLRERNVVATTTPYAPSYARLTPSIRNTPSEIEVALRAIRELA